MAKGRYYKTFMYCWFFNGFVGFLTTVCYKLQTRYDRQKANMVGMGEIEIFLLSTYCQLSEVEKFFFPALFKPRTVLVWISPFKLKMDEITGVEWL